MTATVFLLSPARCRGGRADILARETATFPLAVRLRTKQGVPVAEVFSFLSMLYFRGKVAYARAFATEEAFFVIAPGEGLLLPETPITASDLRRMGEIEVSAKNEAYLGPLLRDARSIARIASVTRVVLLGSIATSKYVEPLLEIFGERLLFPSDFVGRGDMSRGALLLRAARAGHELAYEPVVSAVRRGPRAPGVAKTLRTEREKRAAKSRG